MNPLPPLETLLPKLRARGIALPPGVVHVGAFGDSAALSEDLLGLIRSGRKRGGASLLWGHEADGDPVPAVGDLEVVVDHLGEPVFVTRVAEIEVVPFDAVSAAFAACEGEGDGSLAYWRDVHWDFFTRECRRIGREPALDMQVVCCSFEVIHTL